MKGNLSVGNKLYRIESSRLNKSISPTFSEDKNFKKSRNITLFKVKWPKTNCFY